MTTNERLLDLAIRRAVYVHRFGAALARKSERFIADEILPDLAARLTWRLDRIKRRGRDSGAWTTQRMADLLTDSAAIIGGGTRRMAADVRTALVTLAKSEAVESLRQLERAVPAPVRKMLTFRQLDLRRISEVMEVPVEGKAFGDWWKALGDGAQTRVRVEVTKGLVNGDTTPQIVAKLAPALDVTKSQATTIVNTFVTHATAQAKEKTYAENADVIAETQWVATLDSRTCPRCSPLDGKRFPIGEGPMPALHANCRCVRIPVTKSWRALGIDKADVPETTRASMDGQVAARVSYDDWLARQPAAIRKAAEALRR